MEGMKIMDMDRIEAVIEAVLFTMGESVSVDKLAAAIGHDEETTVKIVHNMMDKYENSNRGIKIIELENAFQMCTKQEFYEDLIKVAATPRKYVLTDVLLETLSIIAYKQPVTKIEIEKIRGVSCEHAVNKLVEYGLAKELGRLDAPGRPMLFGTTEEFLRAFGVTSIDELPTISEDIIERFKDEAEMEIKEDTADDFDENQLTLNI
jgi:segregation and condensation protein B